MHFLTDSSINIVPYSSWRYVSELSPLFSDLISMTKSIFEVIWQTMCFWSLGCFYFSLLNYLRFDLIV